MAVLKRRVQQYTVSVIIDETTDDRDWQIVHLMLTVKGKSYLVEVAKVDTMNHEIAARLVVRTLRDFQIQDLDVHYLVSDSASYNGKAYLEILRPLYPNMVHCRCLCHILSLIGEVLQAISDPLDRCESSWFHSLPLVCIYFRLITMWTGLFTKKPAWRRRFLEYLGQYLPKEQVKMAPRAR